MLIRRTPFRSLLRSVVCVLAMIATGCSGSSKQSAATASTPKVVVDGLSGPTQFVVLHGSNRLLIAQLNGDENAGTGQVLLIDLTTGSKRVLLDKLDKPTGVLLHDGAIWVMTRDNLQRASWDGAGTPGALVKMLPKLPNNGRSEGTLTVMADDRIAFETSGAIDSNGVVVGDSGRLWAYEPSEEFPWLLATGVKNAYAHALLPDGRLLITEIGDNIANPPVEELNIVEVSDKQEGKPVNLGWPTCPGEKKCAGVVSPIATFAPKSTPAGVALSDDGLTAYVSLLTTGQVVAVSVVDGMQRVIGYSLDLPLHVLLGDDGHLLVGEHGAGRIVSIDLNADPKANKP